MQKITLISVLAILCLKTIAQSPPVKPLKIGDTVPDITIRNVYNYPDSVIKLSDLKGKLTILDFWATWCGTCISSFPEMMRLKKTFGKNLEILCINSFSGDDHSKVVKSFANWRQRLDIDITLPYALHDTLLSQSFPHLTIPHYVWIGQDNRVLAITYKDDVTEENIRSVLDGKQISLYVKKDELLYNSDEPLFESGNGGDGTEFLYRSIITPYNRSLGSVSGIKKNEEGLITKIYAINTRLISLLRLAYPELRKYEAAHTIYKVRNPEMFRIQKDQIKERENLYCYEIICPPSTEENIKKYMKSELEKFFNVTVSFGTKKVNCWLLKTNKESHKILSKSDSAYSRMPPDFKEMKFRKMPVKHLTEFLESNLQIPIIDETGIAQDLDMDFPPGFEDYDLPSVQSYLKKQGLSLIPDKRSMKVATIAENNFFSTIQK